jgi:large subunit ribosomal protein L15
MADNASETGLNLHTLRPAQERKTKKRVGRGLGSGKGRYSGRGIKGQKSRAGSHYMPAGFEGGQMPVDMRAPKLRGNTSADAMPIGPFRTYSQPVNLRDLEARFEAGAEVTPETLKAAGLIGSVRKDVKILGSGDLSKKLQVSAHSFSKSAREKIEGAGGSIAWLRGEPVPKRQKPPKRGPGSVTGTVADADETAVSEAVEAGLDEGADTAAETEAS